ncbi:hypothetical protein Tco_1502026 [Tanacetum coccineum]
MQKNLALIAKYFKETLRLANLPITPQLPQTPGPRSGYTTKVQMTIRLHSFGISEAITCSWARKLSVHMQQSGNMLYCKDLVIMLGTQTAKTVKLFDNHQPQEIPEVIPFLESKEWIETKNELYKMMKAYTEKMNQQREHEALLAAQREQELLAQKQAAQEKEEPPQNSDFRQLIEEICGTKASAEQKQKLEEIMKSRKLRIAEPTAKRRTRITSCLQNFKIITKESIIPINNTPQISPVNAITYEEHEYSLSMGDKHLDTIPETELDVENLIPTPSESEVTPNNKSECDVPACDESSPTFTTFSNPLFNNDFTSSDDKSLTKEDIPMENFKIYSNPLCDEEIISTKIDPHQINAESDLIESLLNRDTLIDSSPKFDFLLEKFSGELAHIDPIPPGIVDTDLEPEEEIRLIENLLYENSSPKERNSEIADTIVESLSPHPIPVKDSDSLMEEIDLFLASDESMPPGIENDDYDSEGDIRFLEESLSNDPLPFPEYESSNLDHFNDPSSPRPPPEPPDVEICLNFEPNTGVLTTKVVKGIFEHYVLMPNILPTLPTLDPDLDFTPSHDSFGSGNKIFYPGIFIEVQSERLLSRDEFSISFIRDPLSSVFDTLLPFSSENEDKVFNPGILISPFLSHRDKITSNISASPMMMYGGDIPLLDDCPDFEDSRALSKYGEGSNAQQHNGHRFKGSSHQCLQQDDITMAIDWVLHTLIQRPNGDALREVQFSQNFPQTPEQDCGYYTPRYKKRRKSDWTVFGNPEGNNCWKLGKLRPKRLETSTNHKGKDVACVNKLEKGVSLQAEPSDC